MSDKQTLLRVRNLRTYFRTDDGLAKAVDGVSFRIGAGQMLALVGESGCGKSVTAFSILRLLQTPPAMILSERFLQRQGYTIGESLSAAAPSIIEFDGQNLLDLDEGRMRHVRGEKISMIFQEPMSSLNPVYTCGNQIVEAVQLHRPMSSQAAKALAVEMLAKVGIPDPAQRFDEYPHQLSGGMRQRVMIAMALSCNPRLLIADEPTTALDVTIQAQILDLLKELQTQAGLSILLITHDLAVVAEVADSVAVMYASKIVELTDVKTLFADSRHPYTQGLFRSVPRLGQHKQRLESIPGAVPNPLNFPTGCKFHPRCRRTREIAAHLAAAETVEIFADEPVRVARRCCCQEPPLREVKKGHWVACWETPDYQNAPQTDPSEQTTCANSGISTSKNQRNPAM